MVSDDVLKELCDSYLKMQIVLTNKRLFRCINKEYCQLEAKKKMTDLLASAADRSMDPRSHRLEQTPPTTTPREPPLAVAIHAADAEPVPDPGIPVPRPRRRVRNRPRPPPIPGPPIPGPPIPAPPTGPTPAPPIPSQTPVPLDPKEVFDETTPQVQAWLLEARRTTQGPPDEQAEYETFVNGFDPARRLAFAAELRNVGLGEAEWFSMQRRIADDTVDDERAALPRGSDEKAPEESEEPEEEEKDATRVTADPRAPESASEEFVDPEEDGEGDVSEAEDSLTSVGGRPASVQIDMHGIPADELKPVDPTPEDYNTDNWRGPKRASAGQRGGYPMSRTQDGAHFLYWVWKSPSQTNRQDAKGEWQFLERRRVPRRS